jgi:filamentous hemagglutinin family protein
MFGLRAALVLTVFAHPLMGGVVLDGSFGTKGAVPSISNNFTIQSTFGKQKGGNLFQSFSQFNLTSSQTATFAGPSNVHNILARVTSGSPSSIDGTIKTDPMMGDPNLFFMNPAGVIFGKHAQLDLKGSFAVTTANYLKLAGGGRFNANLGGGDVLTSAPVSAFGFLNSTPGAVSITGSNTRNSPGPGQLSAAPGKSFSIVAGDITMNASRIEGKESRVNLVSVKSPGEAKLDATALATDLNSPIDVTEFTAMGTIDIRNSATIITNRKKLVPGLQLGGPVFIRAGTFLLDSSQISSPSFTGSQNEVSKIDVQANDVRIIDGSRISASTFGTADAGNITVIADSLVIDGRGVVTTGLFALGSFDKSTISSGDGGAITVEAANVKLINAGQIGAYSAGFGNGGTVNLTATDSLRIDGKGLIGAGLSAGITADARRKNGGDITVTAGDMRIIGGGEISTGTFGTGFGGEIEVTADSLRIDGTGSKEGLIWSKDNPVSGNTRVFHGTGILALSYGRGNGGNITVKAPVLSIVGGAQIAAAGFGTGDGGRVNLTAYDSLVIDGTGAVGNVLFGTGIFADALGRSGNGGKIALTAGDSKITYGGQIAADTFGIGLGGDVMVNTESLRVDGGGLDLRAGIFARAHSGGNGGNVAVRADDVRILAGARISASTQGSADAGNVTVNADSLLIDGRGVVTTGLFALGSSSGDGGAVTVEAGNVEMINAGQIGAFATGSGDGGTVNLIATDSLLIDGKDLVGPGLSAGITADAKLGKGGDITVTAADMKMIRGGEISTGTFGTGFGGNVKVTADSLLIDGTGFKDDLIPSKDNPISDDTSVFHGTGILALGYGSGNGGRIDVQAPALSIKGGAQIAAGAFGTGDGGTVAVTGDSLLIDGKGALGNVLFGTGIFTDAEPSVVSDAIKGTHATAGEIMVHATSNLTITSGGEISSSTSTNGNGGSVSVIAGSLSVDGGGATGIFADTRPFLTVDSQGNKLTFRGHGDAGDVTVQATDATITDGGQIAASTFDAGEGGSVEVTAKDSLLIDGSDSGIFAVAGFAGLAKTGDGGDVVVNAGDLSLQNRGAVSAASFTSGDAGSVRLRRIGTLSLDSGSSISSANTGSGDGGSVRINTTGPVIVKDGSSISTESAVGNAGDIKLTSGGEIKLKDQSSITASAGVNGGNITITAPGQLVYLMDSSITATAGSTGVSGTGGNITIDQPQFIVANDSLISANATVGTNGNVVLDSDFLFTSNSTIFATGTINITAPDLDLGAQLITLPSSLLSAANQLQERCTALLQGDFSSFISIGRGGTEPSPEELQEEF